MDYGNYAAPIREAWMPHATNRYSELGRDTKSTLLPPHSNLMQGTKDPALTIQTSTQQALRNTNARNVINMKPESEVRRIRRSKSIENLRKPPNKETNTSDQPKTIPSTTSSRTLSPSHRDGTMKRHKSGPLKRTLRKVFSRSSDDAFEEIPRPSTTGRVSMTLAFPL